MEKRELLKLENVSFAYRGGKRLFNSLSMTFRAGEFTVLTGPNGSGKSTLLLLGCGILRPEKGRVLLNGEDLLRIPAQERAKHLAVTFQLASRSLPFRVRDLVILGRLARRKWYEPYSAEDRAAAWRSVFTMAFPAGKSSGCFLRRR